MALEPLPRIRVDFNELAGSDLVLLAKTDRAQCEDGSEITLHAGLLVVACEYNEYAGGTAEFLSSTK